MMFAAIYIQALLLFAYFMALQSRAIGAGLTKAPIGELVFGLCISVFGYLYTGNPWAIPAGAILSGLIGHNMGHTNIYHMGTDADAMVQRLNTIDIILEPLVRLGIKRRSTAYCVVGMAIKGALIGAGSFSPWFILYMAIATPFAYWVSFTLSEDSPIAEWLVGLFAAVGLYAFVFTVAWCRIMHCGLPLLPL